MDTSITKILQAVQEEFPPARSSGNGKPRRQSSNASTDSNDIPIMDDNSLPTSSELYSASTFSSALSMSPPQEEASSYIHTSASKNHPTDGQSTPRAARTASSTSMEAFEKNNASTSNQFLPERQEVSTTSTLPREFPVVFLRFMHSANDFPKWPITFLLYHTTMIARIDTQVQNKQPPSSSSTSSRSPRLNSAPSFISMPSSSSSNNSNKLTAGFKPSSMLHKNDALMLTPGGDDIPFQFKKRPNMQDRRPSHEIFA